MYAKSFLALDGNGRFTGTHTAQTAPYDCYCCHLCDSALQFHPQYDTERPWFEHTVEELSAALSVCKARTSGEPSHPATAILCTGYLTTGFPGRLALLWL